MKNKKIRGKPMNKHEIDLLKELIENKIESAIKIDKLQQELEKAKKKAVRAATRNGKK